MSECDDNKKDVADNDDRMTNTDQQRPERGIGREQEMSDTSNDIWHDTRQTGGGPRMANVLTSQA